MLAALQETALARLPAIRSILQIGRNPLEFMVELAEKGDIARFQIGHTHWVVLYHPDDIETLFVKQRSKTIKDQVTRGLDAVLGEGLLTSEGGLWKRQRRTIAPSFRPKHLSAYARAMIQSAEEGLAPTGRLDLHHTMTQITLAIVIRTLFGAEPTSEAGQAGVILDELMTCFEREQRTLWRVIPKVVPARHRRRVDELSAELGVLIQQLVDQAREEGTEDRDDLLARLLEARDEDGNAMSDAQLRDELVTLFLAGHETTAITLTMTLWLLAEHPEWQERVAAELEGVEMTGRAVLKLPMLNAVLDESMRLYPPAWAVGREATEAFDVGDERINPGDQVLAVQWAVHRDERWWTQPDAFRPDRWLNGETEDLARFAFFPFGGGQRVCVGSHFARMEALLVLAVWIRERRLQRIDGFVPDLLPAVTLRPRSGVLVDVTARTGTMA